MGFPGGSDGKEYACNEGKDALEKGMATHSSIVAISFSNAWRGKVKVKSLSRVRLLVTPWTAAQPCRKHSDTTEVT